jgi:hypothetical protein
MGMVGYRQEAACTLNLEVWSRGVLEGTRRGDILEGCGTERWWR